MKPKQYTTVAAIAEDIPPTAQIMKITLTLRTEGMPATVTRAEIHEFINAVRLAARELFRQEPQLSMTRGKPKREPKP